MHRICLVALILVLTIGLGAAQDDGRIGVAEEFETVEGWGANNPKAPATLEGDGEHLILTDHEGGEVTWGTSAYKTIKNIDIDRYPWLVVKVDEMTGGFGAKLVNRSNGEKVSVLQGLGEPGLITQNIAESTGWSGVLDLAVGLYAQRDGSRIKVDWLRFVSELTDEERAAIPKQVNVEIVPLSGLEQLAAREGATSESSEPPFPSERFIYMDPVTHAWVWRMTDHPGIERHEYYDIPAWNADGSLMILMSRRGQGRYWLMDAVGENIRPFPEPEDGGDLPRPRWTYTDPDSVFIYRSDDESTTVFKMSVHDGSLEEVVSIPEGNLSMEPPHPDDEHFLFHRNRQQFWVVDASGEFTQFDLWPTHRRRFTKADDYSIFINRNQDPETPDVRRRTSWVCTREGEDLVMLTDGEGGHPDWSPDGSTLGYFGSGGIWLVDRDGTNRRLLTETSGGHGGFGLNGEYHVSDAAHGGPYREQVFVSHLETGKVHPICFHHSSYSGWASGVSDPEATHPAPIGSPDSTKIAYDSDMMGQPDMWVAVWQFPDRPVDLAAERDGEAVSLNWARPELSKELRGYNVYRRDSFDGEWQKIAELLDEPRHTDAGAAGGPWDYGVTCEEHSGLESRMAIAWGGDRTVIDIEPEALELPEEATTVLDQRCGDGYYIAAREGEAAVNLGEHDIERVYVWARLRDPDEAGGGWSVMRGTSESSGAKPGADWQWLRTEEAVAGDGAVTLALDTAVEVDQVLLTDDPGLAPVGVVGATNVAPDAPGSVTVDNTESTSITLSWEPVEGAEYYRLYATRDPELEPGNATLVGTPTETNFRDAGLVPNSRYRYQVTAMDGWGNESEPTEMIEAETRGTETTYMYLDAEDAEVEAPMTFEADPDTVSGGYVHVPDDHSDAKYVEEGTATLTFEVPADGDYMLWGRTMGLDGKSDSFYVRLDGGEESEWHVSHARDGKPEWRWRQVETLQPARLEAGEHTLTLRSREDGTRLDTVIVTNDPTFEPVGMQPRFERGELLYSNDFDDEDALESWVVEGAVRERIEDGKLHLEAYNEGATKGVAWCLEDFEDPVEITYTYKPLTPHGLSIIFFMAEGRDGEDIFSWERDGTFSQYIKGKMNTYHISYHRHFTDRCNVRKNYGFHLVAEAIDPCRMTGHEYQITVRKFGPHVQFLVDGRLVHNWYDDGRAGGPPHNSGKIGFRHTRECQALYDDLRVYRLEKG